MFHRPHGFSFNRLLFTFALIMMSSNFKIHAQSPVPDTASVELIANGFSLSEGPYWHLDGYLLFSDVSESRIYKWTEDEGVQLVKLFSGQTNGITGDLYGNVIIAQHSARRISRLSSDFTNTTPLATTYDGSKFHSPNDLVVKSDGAVFFTDPPWGGNPAELDFHGVFRIPPDGGEAQLLVDSLSYPNGIAFSPDESKLYVAETNNSKIHVFDVIDDSTLANGKVFGVANEHGNPDQTSADGMKVDKAGNVWATGSEGVIIFSPDGDVLDIINVPGSTTNLGWGGNERLTLFITNFSGLYKIDLGPLDRPEPPSNLQHSKGDNSISLTWEGSSEAIKNITVYRSEDNGEFEKIHASAFTQAFTDTTIDPDRSYSYKVTMTDVMGFQSDFSNETSFVGTSVEELNDGLNSFSLGQNYPNPFNPSTVIPFQLGKSGMVKLSIYSSTGQLIETLIDKNMTMGNHEIEWDASGFASGFYIYRLKTESFTASEKLLLIK